MKAAEIARALKGKRSGHYWSCRCPAHHDTSPSLSIWDGDVAVLVHCWAGCDPCDVIAALRARGLWERREKARPRSRQNHQPHEPIS